MSEDREFCILAVDDDRFNLRVLTDILKTSYAVITANCGEDALAIARERQPALILLDIVMPGMDGFEVLKELKGNDATRNIPVICITGLKNVKDEERGFFLGAVDYITKPFQNSIVKARVATHLQIVKHIRTIERLGMIDALTDLPNRRSFEKQIGAEWGRGVREKTWLSLLMIDIDNFKNYNDTYGHPQGDLLLQSVSRVLSSTLRRSTDHAARIGGEEFAVILPDTDLHGAQKIAEDIRRNVGETEVPCRDNNSLTSVTVSIGVSSVIPTMEGSISDFFSTSDKALYTAKKEGRNRVCSTCKGRDHNAI